jgi:hypothetical protein
MVESCYAPHHGENIKIVISNLSQGRLFHGSNYGTTTSGIVPDTPTFITIHQCPTGTVEIYTGNYSSAILYGTSTCDPDLYSIIRLRSIVSGSPCSTKVSIVCAIATLSGVGTEFLRLYEDISEVPLILIAGDDLTNGIGYVEVITLGEEVMDSNRCLGVTRNDAESLYRTGVVIVAKCSSIPCIAPILITGRGAFVITCHEVAQRITLLIILYCVAAAIIAIDGGVG